MVLPEARRGEDDRPHPRIWVNVLPGRMRVRGTDLPLIPPDPKAEHHGQPQDVAESLEILTNVIVSWQEDLSTSGRVPDGPIVFAVSGDRSAGWRRIRHLWNLAVHDPRLRARGLQWATWHAPDAFSHDISVQSARASIEPEADDFAEAPKVVLSVTNAEPRTIEVAVGGRRWSFEEPPDPFADESFVERANESWWEI